MMFKRHITRNRGCLAKHNFKSGIFTGVTNNGLTVNRATVMCLCVCVGMQSVAKPQLSQDNFLINELVREYLDFNGYKHASSVLLAGMCMCVFGLKITTRNCGQFDCVVSKFWYC